MVQTSKFFVLLYLWWFAPLNLDGIAWWDMFCICHNVFWLVNIVRVLGRKKGTGSCLGKLSLDVQSVYGVTIRTKHVWTMGNSFTWNYTNMRSFGVSCLILWWFKFPLWLIDLLYLYSESLYGFDVVPKATWFLFLIYNFFELRYTIQLTSLVNIILKLY